MKLIHRKSCDSLSNKGIGKGHSCVGPLIDSFSPNCKISLISFGYTFRQVKEVSQPRFVNLSKCMPIFSMSIPQKDCLMLYVQVDR